MNEDKIFELSDKQSKKQFDLDELCYAVRTNDALLATKCLIDCNADGDKRKKSDIAYKLPPKIRKLIAPFAPWIMKMLIGFVIWMVKMCNKLEDRQYKQKRRKK